MVALNKHFAPENPHSVEENRVGDFFADRAKSSRVNRLSAQQPRLEKAHGYDETASGMFFYGFRYYDPVTGRWPSRDPLGESGGQNLYAMLGNNPLNQWDIMGLKCNEPAYSNCAKYVTDDYQEMLDEEVARHTQEQGDADDTWRDLKAGFMISKNACIDNCEWLYDDWYETPQRLICLRACDFDYGILYTAGRASYEIVSLALAALTGANRWQIEDFKTKGLQQCFDNHCCE